jgi:hypothetical protein
LISFLFSISCLQPILLLFLTGMQTNNTFQLQMQLTISAVRYNSLQIQLTSSGSTFQIQIQLTISAVRYNTFPAPDSAHHF